LKKDPVTLIGTKHQLTLIATLSNVVKLTGDYNTSISWHLIIIGDLFKKVACARKEIG